MEMYTHNILKAEYKCTSIMNSELSFPSPISAENLFGLDLST